MLKIFYDLEPFFKDNYRRIGVREYARERGVSAPTASKLLANLKKEGLLEQEKERNYLLYVTNKENLILIQLARLYWLQKLINIGLIEHLKREFINPLIILFGSFSKAEVRKESDIDIALFSVTDKDINLKSFEKKLKRPIQLFKYKNPDGVPNKDLMKNFRNGFIMAGGW